MFIHWLRRHKDTVLFLGYFFMREHQRPPQPSFFYPHLASNRIPPFHKTPATVTRIRKCHRRHGSRRETSESPVSLNGELSLRARRTQRRRLHLDLVRARQHERKRSGEEKKTPKTNGEQRREPPHTVVTHCTTPGSSEEEGAGSRYATRNTKSVFVISDDKKSRRDVKANGAKRVFIVTVDAWWVGGGASVVVPEVVRLNNTRSERIRMDLQHN